MPWTVENPPPPAKNWTDEEKKKCVKAANDELAGGSTDEEAVFACIHAAGKSKRGKSMDEELYLKEFDEEAFKRYISPEEREDMESSDFAGKGTSFPIKTPADVAAAAASLGRAGPDNYDTETIKRNIIRIAKRKGAEFVAQLPKAWREEKKSVDDFLCVKSLGQNRFGGYLVLWGDPERKDLTGEYFTPETQEMLNVFEAVGGIPAMYHHASDDTVKSDVLGKVDVMTFDDIGLWVETQARKAAKYRDAIAELIERGALYWSSSCFPRSRKVAPDGKIERWTICEATLTPTPAEHRMVDRPIQAIKSIYEQAGLTFPDDKGSEATVASPAGDADDARQRAIREGLARLRLLKVKLGLREK